MEGLLLLLLFGGCTAALTSPIVSPIVVVILLVSATLRRKAAPFFRVGIITGFMLLVSYSVASNSSDPLYTSARYHSSVRNEAGFNEYFVLATLTFVLMGVQIGFILPSKPAITKSWLDVVGHALLWNFIVGYLVLGMMNCFLGVFKEFSRGDLFAEIWATTLFYIFGVFLIPALATGLTKLGLFYYQRGLKSKPP